jgi:type I restriction enzyme, S subunit
MSWNKVKVGDFLIRVKDLIPIEKDKEYKLVTIKLYHKGVQLRKRELGGNISADKMSRVKSGQFILSGIDARNGAFGIIPPELDGAVVTNDFWHFDIDKHIMSKEYFLWLTSTPFFDDICNKASDGTTNRIRLQADRFYTQELFIPDIDNQHEVVEELKKQGNKINSLKKEYSYQLTQLENLNQAILQEAVQGKLVKQDPKDEPASELLKRIKAEKAKSGKKEKPLPPIKPEEIPFEIPENWVWCRLGEVVNLSRGRFSIRPRNDKSCYGGDYPFIQIGSLDSKGSVINDFTQTLNEKGLKASKQFPSPSPTIRAKTHSGGNRKAISQNQTIKRTHHRQPTSHRAVAKSIAASGV